jgi:tetratricopeptide (TPR) repeat protein
LLLLSASIPASASHLSDALGLEAKGRLSESRDLLQTAIPELRAAGDLSGLARALSASARISVAFGDYRGAIQTADDAASLRIKLNDETGLSEDYNTLGLANLYLGNYQLALANYERALSLDRRRRQVEAEIARLNNIGNVFYFRGQYQDALRTYQQAMDRIAGAGNQPWTARRRQLTIANFASLYQRLGKEQAALELYRQLTGTPQSLPRTEYAQLLLNEGVLYRRLGDPVKALERYRSAQDIFAAEHHRDGEIGALRNTGIARAVDLDDPAAAVDAFTAALRLARQSSDTRGIVQASLYRAQVLLLMGRLRDAEDDLRAALDGAQKTGLVEEQWKAQYGLGKLAEFAGRPDAATDLYRQAITGIESMRAGLERTRLRSEFLADKRDVYDSLISLTLSRPDPPPAAVFALMEQSRARSLDDRRSSVQPNAMSLEAVQAVLPEQTVFVEYWIGAAGIAALWITRSGAGIVHHTAPYLPQQSPEEFVLSLQKGDGRWQELSREWGIWLLAGIPGARHFIAAPDGPIGTLPWEALTVPGSGRLLIEDCDVSYVPAARWLAAAGRHGRGRLLPWRTQLVAFGDPPVAGVEASGESAQWQPLVAAADEIRSIAALLPGRAETYVGAAARKRELLSRRLEGVSLLHFSTHAVVDAENPDRSRILLAADTPGASWDYLFQPEVYGLDLQGVDLATISACETARGKMLRGDGVQAFSQAFLAAGAAATVTSLWRVADRPTAQFMEQFYYHLARGEPKAVALRSAKLQFLKSSSRLSAPRYWAAFVLDGDGLNPCVQALSWSFLLASAGAVALMAGAWFARQRARGRRPATAASARP